MLREINIADHSDARDSEVWWCLCVLTSPDYPDSRLSDMVSEVEAKSVLCDRRSGDRFSAMVKNVVGIDFEILHRFSHLHRSWQPRLVKPENAAFVVFTSGITGKPKAALLEHRSVCTSLYVNTQVMKINPATRALQFAAYTFDASICEIFSPLIVGACVCVTSEEERMNGLVQVINEREADWIMLTSTVAHLIEPLEVPKTSHPCVRRRSPFATSPPKMARAGH